MTISDSNHLLAALFVVISVSSQKQWDRIVSIFKFKLCSHDVVHCIPRSRVAPNSVSKQGFKSQWIKGVFQILILQPP